MTEAWSDLVWSALRNFGDGLLAVLPGILATLSLIVIGLVAAWLVSRLLRQLARGLAFDRRAEQWGLAGLMSRAGIRRSPSDAVLTTAFWLVFLFFATLAIDTMPIPGTGRVTQFLFAWVPIVMSAALMLLIGWLTANFIGQGVLLAAVNAGVPEARYLARGARWGVVLFAIAMALTHLGIAKELVLLAFGIAFGGLVLALSIAFGIGGRGLAREILERRRHREREALDREPVSHL